MANNKDNGFIPIVFDSGAIDWIDESKNFKNTEFAQAKEKCFSDYDNTCQYCGYKTDKTHTSGCGLEILHLDGNGNNHNQKNIIPICSYCRACFNLSYAEEKGCSLIYAPEFNQYELSYIYRLLFIYRDKVSGNVNGKKTPKRMGSDNSNYLKDMLDSLEVLNTSLMSRGEYAKRILGTSSAGELGTVIENIKKTVGEISEVSNLFKNDKPSFNKNGEQYKAIGKNKKNIDEDKYKIFIKNKASILDGIRLIFTKPLMNNALFKKNPSSLASIGFDKALQKIQEEK